jgi:uncharacterized protein YjiS (DUF1127 family)
MRRIEIDYVQIILALDATGGRRAAAAERLGISPATLRRRMKEEGIDRYHWQPDIRRRIVTEVEGDIVIDGLAHGHAPSALKMWKELERAQGINEPRRMSDRELKDIRAHWKGAARYKWAGKQRQA